MRFETMHKTIGLQTINEAARTLRISHRQLRRLIHRQSDPLPVARIGYRTVRIDPAALDAWIARQTTPAGKA